MLRYITIAFVGMFVVFQGTAQADMIRFATGYPSLESTDGRPHINNVTDLWGDATVWNVFELQINRPTTIQQVRGVGTELGPAPLDLGDFDADLRIFSSIAAFGASPGNADIANVQLNPTSVAPFGTTQFNYPNYFLEFDVSTPLVLQPGTYWVSVDVARFGPAWAWQESAINLGSAYQVVDGLLPIPFHLLNTFPDFYTTATPAIDLIGTRQPIRPCLREVLRRELRHYARRSGPDLDSNGRGKVADTRKIAEIRKNCRLP